MTDLESPADDSHDDTADLPSDGWQLDASQGTDGAGEEDWPAEDLESAYRRALDANNAVEWDFAQLPPDSASDESSFENEGSSVDTESCPSADETSEITGPDDPDGSQSERLSMRQVVEAALFVGGEPITTKRLCFMLRGDYDLDFIEDTIEDLNHQYEHEARPYEVRLGEGGYRLVLHEDFQRVRNRVFGIGPREVKLSQDVLEVLALVAYRQPITQAEIEALGRAAAGPLLRQLLRRELIAIRRDETNRKKVEYVTTKRFLSVFGISSIDELPQADELAFK